MKSVGVQGYHSGMLACQDGDQRHEYLSLHDKDSKWVDGTLANHLADKNIRKKIASHLGCSVKDLPAFKRSRTYVRSDSEKK